MKLNDKEYLLMYGGDKTENIVAIENVPNNDGVVELFIRQDGKVQRVYDTMDYLVFVNEKDSIFDKLTTGTRYNFLLGNNFFNRVIYCDTKKQMYYVKSNADLAYQPLPNSQYYLQSGKTLFKGMKFDDPLRMYFDIETLTEDGYEFTNPQRPFDRICIIAIHFNHTYDDVILTLNDDGLTSEREGVVRCSTEKKLLEKFVEVVRKTDPDVLLFHNGFRFDYPFILERATMHNVKLALGRNGSEPYCFDTNIKFADKSEEFTNISIYGRHVIDTYFEAKKYDIVKRSLPSYRLKEIVKSLGKASDDRTYIEGDEITHYWFNRRDELLSYALDDVLETEIVAQNLAQSGFYTTQLMPLSYQDVSRYGTGTLIDLWLVRDYVREEYAIPTPDPKYDFEGGSTGIVKFGVTKGRLVYADVSSLYPTIRDIFNIKPPKDELDVFDTKMRMLKKLRIEWKDTGRRLEGEVKKIDEYLQSM